MQPPRPISQCHAPSRNEFDKRYFTRQEPVVLKGLLDGWAGMQNWSPGDFKTRFGDQLAPTITLDDGAVRVDARRGIQSQMTRLTEVLDDMDAGISRLYLMATQNELPAGLKTELPQFEYCKHAPWKRTKIWCSSPGTRSALHYDLNDNLHAVVWGRKKFVLFSPDDTSNLYPSNLFSGIPNASRIDLDHVDLDQFPRAAQARPWICELAPGDTLYIPRRWWHHVTSIESTISVNTWWAVGTQVLVAAAAGIFKRIYGISR